MSAEGMTPDPEAALAFLNILRPGGPWVLTAITPDGPTTTETFSKPDTAAAWIVRQNVDRNVYVMAAEAAGVLRKKASKADVARTRHLWADLDGGPRSLNGHVPPPTAIVASGGGLNTYWALAAPIEDAIEIEARNRWISHELGADHCWNCDQILRLPGTVNWPNKKKRSQGRTPVLARCIEHHPDRVYDLGDFGRIDGTEQKDGARSDIGDDIQLLTLDDLPAEIREKLTATAQRLIQEGPRPREYHDDRSPAVWAVTGALVRAGASDDQIAGLLLNPALPIHEHIRDQKGHGPRAYVARQIERARGGSDWEQHLAEAIAELNERHFVAAMGGSVRIAKSVYDVAFNRERLVFMRKDDMQLHYAHRRYKIGERKSGADIVAGLGEAWIGHRDRRTYDRIVLIPSGPCPDDVYNLWRGFGCTPQPGGDWPTLATHLLAVVCNGRRADYEWLIGWMAYVVQHPELPAEVAVVLRGLQGIGKGMVGQMLMRIFGNHGLHISQPRHLTGNFNAHLVDTIFLFVDEAFWAGDKPGEGVLKALITERTLMIEPKGVDAFPMPNRLKILMLSNNEWVVPVTADARRYFVLDVPDTFMDHPDYFTKLAAAIAGDELAAFLDYLLGLDLSKFDHRRPPHTDALNRQKLISGDSFQKFWLDCLTTGTIADAEAGGDWPKLVRCAGLHETYLAHARAHGDRHPLTEEQMGVHLRKLCGDLKRIRPRAMDNKTLRSWHYTLQGLDQCRADFLRAMNIGRHEWPKAEGDP